MAARASSRFDPMYLLVPLVVFLVHAASRNITSSDSIWTVHTARSLVLEGNLDLDEYGAELARENYRNTISLGGHRFNIFPFGTPVLAAPFVLAADGVLSVLVPAVPGLERVIRGRSAEEITRMDSIGLHKGVELVTASFFVALAAMFVYVAARRALGRTAPALVATFAFAFCTSAWSTASRALWSHTASMLCNAAVLVLMLPRPDRSVAGFAAGCLLAFGFAIRPTNVIPLVVFAVYMLAAQRKEAPRFLLGAALTGLLLLAFCRIMYHMWLPVYYSPSRLDRPWYFGIALAGNLISPNRGLFIFSPFLIFCLYGIVRGVFGKDGGLNAAVAFIPILHWVVIATFPQWWGGLAYGPRFFTEMMPFLIFLLIPFMKAISAPSFKWRTPAWVIFSLLVLAGFFVHFRGASDWAVFEWVDQPRNLDVYPSRAWDWSDMQIFRGL